MMAVLVMMSMLQRNNENVEEGQDVDILFVFVEKLNSNIKKTLFYKIQIKHNPRWKFFKIWTTK